MTATITPAAVTIPASGMPTQAFSVGSVTVACNLQPTRTAEGLQYQRDTGNATFDLFIAPVDTGGTAVGLTPTQFKTARAVVGGVTYRVVGQAMDPITNGCIYQLLLEVDT